ncbi:MAG: 4Fe-4S dicluster domain-containing protein [Clostridiales bacterium]|nr:4Fe-4S dicluster domain-containing protein [Clostridiales bacterium]
MYYNDFKDIKLSGLGLGCMRLPVVGGDDTKPDQAAVQEMIDYAMANGINYYDTAWGYHGGNSETAVGEALSKYDRESYYLASKFPGYDLSNFGKHEEIFNKQLEKCQTDYFDFYLYHNVCEANIDKYLNDDGGLTEFLLKMKDEGKIRHLGFSCHGSFEVMHSFIKKYWRHLEFCQIQLNYLDFEFQNAKDKVEELNNLGMPIWVMEGLRGGKLAGSVLGAEKILEKSNPDWTPVNWAFGFLETVPGVTMILSGMSDMDQLRQNIEFFDEKKTISDDDIAALLTAAHYETTGKAAGTVPCTACRYCMSKCPQELEIPRLLSLFNEHVYTENGFIAPMALSAIDKDKWPSACIGCGACAAVCPQRIDIPGTMKKFTEMLSK